VIGIGLKLGFVWWASFDVPCFVGPGVDREPHTTY